MASPANYAVNTPEKVEDGGQGGSERSPQGFGRSRLVAIMKVCFFIPFYFSLKKAIMDDILE